MAPIMRVPGRQRSALGSDLLAKNADETVDQALPVERLHEYSGSSGCLGTLPEAFLRVGRDEDNGHPLPSRDKDILKIQAADSWHLHIAYQAGRVADDIRLQELSGGSEGPGGKPERSN